MPVMANAGSLLGTPWQPLAPAQVRVSRDAQRRRGRLRLRCAPLARCASAARTRARTRTPAVALVLAPPSIRAALLRAVAVTDLWAIACCVFCFFAGHAPFQATTEFQMFQVQLQ